MRTIRFARLRFQPRLSHFADERDALDRRKELLLDVIDYKTDINPLLVGTDVADKIELGEWSFGDIQDDGYIIAGRLAKVKEEQDRKRDDEREGFPPVTREGLDTTFFVIDIEESVMAYEYRNNIGEKAPFRILEAAFNAYYDDEEELTMSPLVDKDKVRREISRLSRISRVEFSQLEPTNPDSTDRSKPMDDFLREGGIDRLKLEGINPPDNDEEVDEGIHLEEVKLLDGGLSLAEEGYGSAIVEGTDEEGEEKIVSTDERPIESNARMSTVDDDRNKRRLREKIREALEQLED